MTLSSLDKTISLYYSYQYNPTETVPMTSHNQAFIQKNGNTLTCAHPDSSSIQIYKTKFLMSVLFIKGPRVFILLLYRHIPIDGDCVFIIANSVEAGEMLLASVNN